ncbi:prepilin-type N-terminal cleavage/methylation domain-containing protein [Alkalihalobacillus sp. BA299]|uniref:prepilin-type N-terminal cleavage/methylation domain-containing protein n=1 Tax=Alkalihalobacillus sp. BA299 TaxID=2815938 RepID=UPI001FFDFAB2|nr:prepilin-type N-terminal cleavage/methylation domain-containing protein [Alkalihalobacillus sp. BA299]
MKALIQKRLKNQRGLTLIELLVVIVILGIIAAIAIPMISSNVNDAETNSVAQTVAIVKDAWQRAELDGITVTGVDDLVDEDYVELPDGITCTGDTREDVSCQISK